MLNVFSVLKKQIIVSRDVCRITKDESYSNALRATNISNKHARFIPVSDIHARIVDKMDDDNNNDGFIEVYKMDRPTRQSHTQCEGMLIPSDDDRGPPYRLFVSNLQAQEILDN
ncbi:hypothetical protein Ancab_012705 [Ancistrocladus abbreviatus]